MKRSNDVRTSVTTTVMLIVSYILRLYNNNILIVIYSLSCKSYTIEIIKTLMCGDSMDAQFVRDRITQLRLEKGVSEYKMSYDLGHSRTYINNITSGKCLPMMAEFFEICEYLEVSPTDFFNESIQQPILLRKILEELEGSSDDDLLFVLTVIRKMRKGTDTNAHTHD